MACRIKSSKCEGWLCGRAANGCLAVLLCGATCVQYFCPHDVEVLDGPCYRAVRVEDFHGHDRDLERPERLVDANGLQTSTTTTTEDPNLRLGRMIGVQT